MFVDPVQAVGAGSSQVKPGFGWEGSNDSQCGCAPPDVQVASGPAQVTEAVNLEFTVWTTSGALVSRESLFQLYGVSAATTFLSDPKIIYDNASGRWFTSVFGSTTTGNVIFLAVSSTSDAAGNWTVSRLRPANGDLPDQPILGVSQDLVSLATNDFTSSTFAGSQYWVVNKSALVHGVTAAFATFGPSAGDFSIHPVRYDSAMAGMYLVETFQGGPGSLSLFSVSGVPPANVTVGVQSVLIGNATNPLAAPQPGTSSSLDTSSVHVEDAEWSAGHLWVTFDDACFIGPLNLSCIRIVELNVSGVASVRQDFDIALNNSNLLYGTVTVDSDGNLFVAFGMSSRTVYPSVVATEQAATDPVGTVRPAIFTQTGTSAIACGGVCRYGDYFGSGAEPGTRWVWTAGQYETPSNNWQSWVEAVHAGGPMAASTTATPPATDAGFDVQVTVRIANSSCLPGGPSRCSVMLPFGDTTDGWSNCTTMDSGVTFSHPYPQPGIYRPGVGGMVTVYSSSNCVPLRVVGTVPIVGSAVLVNLTPSLGISVTPGPAIDLGQSFNVSGAPFGGVGPFNYTWITTPPGCSPTAQAWFDCTPTSAGDFTVIVNATDGVGGSSVASANLHVDPDPNVTLSAPSNRSEVGAAISFDAIASGGSGVYSYGWQGLPPDCFGANVSTLRCIPATVGPTTSVIVSVTDSRGISATSAGWSVTVGPPLGARIGSSTTDIAAGASMTLTASATGGFAPYEFHWAGVPTDCAGGAGPVVTCHPSTGAYHVQVTVTDAIGTAANATFNFTAHGGSDWSSLLQASAPWILVAVSAVGTAIVVLTYRRRTTTRPPPPRGSRGAMSEGPPPTN